LRSPVESAVANRRKLVEQANASASLRLPAPDEGFSLDDMPSLAAVSALADAIFRRESGKTKIPNSHLVFISDEAARQISALPLLRTASGLRPCEALAVHTSQVNVERLTIDVIRQLPRTPCWPVGMEPRCVPPKGDKIRTAHVWSDFGPRLQALVDWADKNTGGWLFAPVRKDKWWTENADKIIERGIQLMNLERTAALEAGIAPEDAPPHFDIRIFVRTNSAENDKSGAFKTPKNTRPPLHLPSRRGGGLVNTEV